MIAFDVFGTPAPQGSKTRMPNGAIIEGRSTGQRQRHANWRSAVSVAASKANWDDWMHRQRAPLTGALKLTVTFRFAMPKSRPKADREAGLCPKTSAPDLDKILRATGDALKEGGLIADDALLAAIDACKIETTGWTGASIRIEPWEAG